MILSRTLRPKTTASPAIADMPIPTLDPTERRIFRTLTLRRGQVVPIADLIPPPKWGAPDPRKRRRLFRVRLCVLREKLRASGYARDAIETVVGHGVRFG